MNWNSGWEFKKGAGEWASVVIPHDWMISDVEELYGDNTGYYRKVWREDGGLYGYTFLRFDGVYQDYTVAVNGQVVGEWKHGYTPAIFEIAEFLQQGENIVEVTVRYESPNTRWYSGAGIYRDVEFIRKGAAYIVPDGLRVNGKWRMESGEWELDIDVETGGEDAGCTLRHNYPTRINEKDVVPWSPETPKCYTLVSELLSPTGEVLDTVHTRFGFREVAFSSEDGGKFYLNGKERKIKGVCLHHDLGGLGAAFNIDAARRQLEIMKDMGVNAVRTAHNPSSREFMRLCDEMGLMVMTEFSDVWKMSKTKNDYARFFEEWAARDVATWVRRDRNCPSVIMWSTGNEIYDTHMRPDAAETQRFLETEIRRHDPQFHAAITHCSNYMPWEPTQKVADIVKLVGYNYADYLYEGHREKFADWIIYGGETASTVQSRGVYHFPLAQPTLANDDMQCSSLGNSTTSWGAKSPESVLRIHRPTLGQFIWTGIDYLGEPTPYHTKNCYFGPVDTAGLPKDAFYIYRSEWNDAPTLHLFPHWDWSVGQPVDVRIATNAKSVELFLNGKSLGRRENIDLVADYIVPYESGVLEAVTYDEKGRELMRTSRRSFGDAVALVTETKRYGALTFTEISAIDADGNPVENANNRVHIATREGVTLLALDNGDSTDYEQYQGTTTRRLFSGKLVAICEGEGDAPITATLCDRDIPIRKIELTQGADGLDFQATIHPANATYSDLVWRLADSAGIDSHIAALDGTTVKPCGDGTVYVRCSATNGKPHPDIISVYPVELTGYGKPLLNPYSFVSAGLFTHSNGSLMPGNERGMATGRDGASHMGFADLDFGTGGRDITLWLFPLSGDPFDFEIHNTFPPAEKPLYTAHYELGTQWNAYQPVTYTLPQTLAGVQTLSFVFHQKVHVKGFQFAKL